MMARFAERVPAIIAEHAGLADHAATRNDERDRICANGASNSARGLRLMDRGGESPVLS